MLLVGLTGGIGSGKSTIASIFEHLEIPVFQSDIEGKKVLNDPHVIDELSFLFGKNIITQGSVDRKALAQVVFKSKEALQQLNQIIHPKVGEAFQNWVKNQKQSTNPPYALKEAAILIEEGLHKSLDKTILVTAPKETRIQRVIQRDESSREDVLNRIANQMSDEDKMKEVDYIIDNSGNTSVLEQVLNIHQELVKLSK